MTLIEEGVVIPVWFNELQKHPDDADTTLFGFTKSEWVDLHNCCVFLSRDDTYLLDGLGLTDQEHILTLVSEEQFHKMPLEEIANTLPTAIEAYAPSYDPSELFAKARQTHEEQLTTTIETELCELTPTEISLARQVLDAGYEYQSLLPNLEREFKGIDRPLDFARRQFSPLAEFQFEPNEPLTKNQVLALRIVQAISPTLEVDTPFNKALNELIGRGNSVEWTMKNILIAELSSFVVADPSYPHPILDPNCVFNCEALDEYDLQSVYATLTHHRWLMTHKAYRRMLGIAYWVQDTEKYFYDKSAYPQEFTHLVEHAQLGLLFYPFPSYGERLSEFEVLMFYGITDSTPYLDPAEVASDIHNFHHAYPENEHDRELDTSDWEDEHDKEEEPDREPDNDDSDNGDELDITEIHYTGPYQDAIPNIQDFICMHWGEHTEQMRAFLEQIAFESSDDGKPFPIPYGYIFAEHFQRNRKIEMVAQFTLTNEATIEQALLEIIDKWTDIMPIAPPDAQGQVVIETPI